MTETPKFQNPAKLYVHWATGEDGELRIRKWSTFPDRGGVEYALTPTPVPHLEVSDWQSREARSVILRRARELWNEDQPGTIWHDEAREHYLIRAAMEAGARAALNAAATEGSR